jgi:hypothetical protein
MMQEMPEELLLAFVVQASSVEDLAALRQVASTGAGLWILRHFADGRGFLCIYPFLSYINLA